MWKIEGVAELNGVLKLRVNRIEYVSISVPEQVVSLVWFVILLLAEEIHLLGCIANK